MFPYFQRCGPLFASLLAQPGDPLLINMGADALSTNLQCFESGDCMSLLTNVGMNYLVSKNQKLKTIGLIKADTLSTRVNHNGSCQSGRPMITLERI